MRRRSPLVLSVTLVILAFAVAPASAAPGRSSGARAEHQRIVRYWTPARMKAAIPRREKRPAKARVPAPQPSAGSATVTGASWGTKGGAVRAAVGKVFFSLGGTNYTCSGSVTDDSRTNYSLVLTAAHCAYDEAKDVFATNWMFIPDYESAPTRTCANTKYGCWTAQALVVHKGWADEESFTDEATHHDFAFAVVGEGGKNKKQLDAVVGSFPIRFDAMAKGTRMYAFGYPAAGKYKGTKLVYCAGSVGFDAWNADATYGLGCDMTGGSSGGPWFSDFDESTGTGTQTSLNSYGYSTVKGMMFGPKFNALTKDVYDAANGATANTIAGG